MEWFLIIGLSLNPGNFAAIGYQDQASCQEAETQYTVRGDEAHCVNINATQQLDASVSNSLIALDGRVTAIIDELKKLCGVLSQCTVDDTGKLIITPTQ